MKMQVIFMIDEDNEQNVEAAAFGTDSANIYIKAQSLQDAKALLPKGEELAAKALGKWTPTEASEEQPEEEHYKITPITTEAAKKEMDAYTLTTGGKRFKSGLDLAAAFTEKHDKTGGYKVSQGRFLALISYTRSVYEAIYYSYCYGYKKGYKQARKGGKKC